MVILDPTVERHLADLSDADWSALTARVRPPSCATFEIYLHERWDISKSRAYQMIEASRVTREMSTIVDAELPATESQARELVGLDTELAAQVMRETVNRVRGKVTAKAIRQTRERIIEPEPAKPTPKPKIEPEQIAPEPDDHHYCSDEGFFEQLALAAWDEHPPKNGEDYPSSEFGWWFNDVLEEHWTYTNLCIDPYVVAGLIASLLVRKRDANGAEVLRELAGGIEEHIEKMSGGDAR